jgi:hypothetical protein
VDRNQCQRELNSYFSTAGVGTGPLLVPSLVRPQRINSVSDVGVMVMLALVLATYHKVELTNDSVETFKSQGLKF